ncbi:flavin-containing monooxygenase [uncultured Microbacterium sp.]|uniref:flavin-containing monooxygenase n=2 Tax=Microbacteriaceae TaxID=85023 RepID=UPI00345B8593
MMARSLSHRRVIIVGAGHSGLATAAALRSSGLEPQKDFVIIDSAPPGRRSWATRWQSMKLRSAARHSVVRGFPFPGDGDRYPSKDEMSDYLSSVENALGVKTVWGTRALGITRLGDGSTLHLSTSAGEVQTRNVVCATGAAAVPRVPGWRLELAVPGVVLHSSQYLCPAQIPPGRVLIVGGGLSGVEIAEELASSHDVTLSTRAESSEVSERPIWSRLRRRGPMSESRPRVASTDVTHAAAVTEVHGDTVMFADGASVKPHSVILATGYRPADAWLPDSEPPGQPLHVSARIPGLFTVGMPRYSRADAGTLAGAGRDAAIVARHIVGRP